MTVGWLIWTVWPIVQTVLWLDEEARRREEAAQELTDWLKEWVR